MLVAVGNRGFGIAQVRAWEFEPLAAILCVWVGAPGGALSGFAGELVFQDEEAVATLEILRRHAAAADATLRAMEDMTRADEPVAP